MVLVIRVWYEDEPVARLLGDLRRPVPPSGGTGKQQVDAAVARGTDGICSAVRQWLLDRVPGTGDR
jgi:hypothetical protein